MTRLSTWRLGLRIARRDAMRARGRSLLVIAVIALPVLGFTVVDLTLRGVQLSAEEKLTRSLGQADARYTDIGLGRPVKQPPDNGYAWMGPDAGQADDGLHEPDPTAVRRVIPADTRVLRELSGHLPVRTGTGMTTVDVRETDATDPMTEGMFTLLRGEFPRDSGEVAVTEGFLRSSGLRVGSELRFPTLDDRGYRIAGVYELPDSVKSGEVLARPGALLPEPGPRAVSYLAQVPGGVPWEAVVEANTQGITVESRAVVLNPPPDEDVPLYSEAGQVMQPSGAALTAFGAAVVVAAVIVEVCLLAGPAFAVGARRARRQLGLVAANGGDGRQLRVIMIAGGVVLGAAGAVAGVVTGGVLTVAARPLIEQWVGARFGGWDVRPAEIGAIAALGLITGVLAAVLPARAAARASVLDSLNARPQSGSGGRGVPVARPAVVLVGVSLTLAGAFTRLHVVVLLGMVVAVLGTVALTPALVGAVGRLGRFLPALPRLALRDASRNRGRTAPAVSAVLAAVTVAVAMSTYLVSQAAHERAQYREPQPYGTLLVHAGTAVTGPLLDDARDVAEHQLHVAERVDLARLLPGTRDCGPWNNEGTDCGGLTLVAPQDSTCPEEEVEGGRPGCVEGDEYGGGLSGRFDPSVLVAGPELLDMFGIGDPWAVRALERGEAVVFRERYLSADGRVALELLDEPGGERQRTVSLPAHHSDAHSYGLSVLLPPAAADAAGLATADWGSFYRLAEIPSDRARQGFDGAMHDLLGVHPPVHLELGHTDDSATVLSVLALLAGLIALGAAGVATGLARTDAEPDLATLAAVGAPPGARRALAGLQCGIITLLGAGLGALTGVSAALAVLLTEHRERLDSFHRYDDGWEAAPSEMLVVLPWPVLGLLVVALPVLAGVVAALSARSRPDLARRSG